MNKNRLKLKCSVNSTKTYSHTQNTGTVSEEKKGREDKCKKGQLRKNFAKFPIIKFLVKQNTVFLLGIKTAEFCPSLPYTISKIKVKTLMYKIVYFSWCFQ